MKRIQIKKKGLKPSLNRNIQTFSKTNRMKISKTSNRIQQKKLDFLSKCLGGKTSLQEVKIPKIFS